MEYKIYYYNSLTSTNDKAKEMVEKEEGSIIIAEEQSKGRGRLGRKWYSPKGKSILMSIILKPKIKPTDIQKITLIASVAVSMALEDIGIDSKIKWPNDIIINNKKVCGILTEASIGFENVNYVVVGIGINVNQSIEDIPEELLEKFTSLRIIKAREIDKIKFLNLFLERFKDLYLDFKNNGNINKVIDICREKFTFINKEILVIQGDNKRKGIALDINKDGSLLVKFPEAKESIQIGEVSIRGLNSYT